MTRKPDDWMPLHIGEYQADTAHLTRDQHGAYLLLLMAYWRRGGPLPAIDARLAAIVKATGKEWKALRPVMAEFFVERDGHWHQKRADAELAKANRLTEAKARAGGLGGQAKWGSSPDRDAENRQTRSQRLAAARAIGTHTTEEWEVMVAVFGGLCVRCGVAPEKPFKDHIKPIYQGGSDALENIQPLCPKCNSAKGPEAIDHRENALQNWRECLAKRLADAKQMPAPEPQPKPEHIRFNGFSFGKKSGLLPMTDENKIALFQKWLAEIIGHNGWQIVGQAADPASPNYEEALDFCKKTARANGKGWPHKWPQPVAA